ncbi:MAG TPA: hypothetical protein VK821_01875 [Dehalococcoidia bacterium]|nr:hypothetical protein [Dehalococcoidia bacterium]
MAANDRELLRDLTEALKQTENADTDERQAAVKAVMERHGASAEDVARLLRSARTQQRTQLQGLALRIGDLISQREEAASTADAVEEFLRGLRP